MPARRARLLVLSLLLAAAVASAANEEKKPPPDAGQLAKLVTGLAGEDHAARVAAMAALVKVGEPALEALRGATRDPDPDVRLRAYVTIRAILRATHGEDLVLEGHTDSLVCLDLSRDARLAVTGSNDGTARLWDLDAGKELRRLDGHPERIIGAAFSPDGRRAATACWDQKARVWDVGTGKLLRALDCGSKAFAVAFSPDGKRLATGLERGDVVLWDLATGKAVRRLEGHTAAAYVLRFSGDGRLLVSAGKDHKVRVWRLKR
jgi:WD40 repeat protein